MPYSRQDIGEADIQAVVDVLHSEWITQGPSIKRFETDVANYCGVRFAVAVSSGTAALHLACLVCGLKPGDMHWTSPNTFVASANCALYCGASVDFVDIDPKTYQLSTQLLEQKLELAAKTGRLPRVLVPVHFAGQPCEMGEIARLSKHYGFFVIEDAAHAIGSRYRNSKIGACTYSDLTVFSFHPVKIVTTGEGGMVLTNRQDFYEMLLRLRAHGITRDSDQMEGPSHGPWYYQQIELGYNYRMTDFQAALGTSQMQKLDQFVSRRHCIAERYNLALQKLPLILPWQHPDSYSSFHLYVIRLKPNEISKTHRQIFEELRSQGIGVNLHYIPVHMHPYYQRLGFKKGDFPQAEQYYQEAISLPMYSALSDEDQDRVISVLEKTVV